jgi:hypothetical protein
VGRRSTQTPTGTSPEKGQLTERRSLVEKSNDMSFQLMRSSTLRRRTKEPKLARSTREMERRPREAKN